jgi:hypothetical protein
MHYEVIVKPYLCALIHEMISVGNAAGICDECQAEHDVHPGFRRFGYPPRRRISLQCQLGNLHWQDFHLLDHQLASLHYPGAL